MKSIVYRNYSNANNKNRLLVSKNIVFLLVTLLMLCVTSAHAQEDRQIWLEGESFSVGTLLQEIERQADVTILNVGPAVNRNELIMPETASPEFVRDIIDQVLAGTAFVFRDANTFTVIIVERADGTLEQVFVDSAGQIRGIDEIFGEEALGLRVGTLDQMLLDRVLSGHQYTFRSTGVYSVVTLMVYDVGRYVERQIVVDLATRQIVPLEQFLNPQLPPHFDTFVFPTDYFPRFSLKTNLLYGATTTINLGAEFFLNRYFTLDLLAGWNPWRHRANVKFAHWMIQPTLRFWIQEPFNGHFLGLSLMYCNFNVSGIRPPYNLIGRHLEPTMTGVGTVGTFRMFSRLAQGGNDGYRFRGDAYSISLQYGHQWVLSPRWSIEAFINVGYMFLDYQLWRGGWCGRRLGSETRHYWGPTNAGISLIYIIR